MGAELCLPHDMGGGGIWGAPFGRHAALRLFHFFKLIFLRDITRQFLSCPSRKVAEKSSCPPENQLVFGRADEC